jgi:ribosomal protein S18 acetylase RimI-like enzyme
MKDDGRVRPSSHATCPRREWEEDLVKSALGQSPAGLAVRPYQSADAAAVLELINADRLPGQPACSMRMLSDALAGRSMIDAAWWKELRAPATDVLVAEHSQLVGVVSYAIRRSDRAGIVLWLHGREGASLVESLLAHALAALDGAATHHAFQFASALGLGLEGLPVRHRPVTDAALRRAGFHGVDLWRYMRRELPAPELSGQPVATVRPTEDRTGWRLEVQTPTGMVIADAEIGEPVDGIGVLWWIGVHPGHRAKGLGRALIGQSLKLLAERGAHEVILFVDDDESGGERDRTAANRLHDASGFEEVDRLSSYTRPDH